MLQNETLRVSRGFATHEVQSRKSSGVAGAAAITMVTAFELVFSKIFSHREGFGTQSKTHQT